MVTFSELPLEIKWKVFEKVPKFDLCRIYLNHPTLQPLISPILFEITNIFVVESYEDREDICVVDGESLEFLIVKDPLNILYIEVKATGLRKFIEKGFYKEMKSVHFILHHLSSANISACLDTVDWFMTDYVLNDLSLGISFTKGSMENVNINRICIKTAHHLAFDTNFDFSQFEELQKKGLRELQYLHLGIVEGVTKIDDFQGLESLKLLQIKDMDSIEEISNIKVLKNLEVLKLTHLKSLTTISPLKKTSLLEEVTIEGTRIKEFEFENLKKLQKLSIEASSIKTINMKGVNNLREVFIHTTFIDYRTFPRNVNEPIFSNNKDIMHFYVRGGKRSNFLAPISYLGEFGTLKFLKELKLTSLGISAIDGLENNKKLKKLSLSENEIKVIQNLDNLKKSLSLSQNKISVLENISELKRLKHLNLNYNMIKKLESIKNLKRLQVLSISHNKLEKIECLGTLRLSILDVAYNQIKKIEDTSYLANLQQFYCEKNPIANEMTNETANEEEQSQ